MKKYYSDYVRHCTRQYYNLQSAPSAINDRVTFNNYISVSNVLDKYTTADQVLLKSIYTSESMQKSVEQYAFKMGVKSEQIWYIIQTYEKLVAIERGLL